MNNTFRRFRRPFLANGKFGKYLAYAIGEIILVVIGILIALQINNWNEARKLKVAEKEFYDGVKNDLTQDKAYIKTVLALAQKKVTVYNIISNNLNNLYNENRAELDSLLTIYFSSQRTFYPISGSFEAAVSSNEINRFQNKELRQAVTKLYNSTYARLMDNAEDTDNRWFSVVKKYSRIRRTGHIGEMNEFQREEFLDDIFYHMYGLDHYSKNLKKAVVAIDSLIIAQSKFLAN